MDYARYGEPWWVQTVLTQNDDLVIPSPTVRHPDGNQGRGHLNASCLVITGLHYALTSGSFTLLSVDATDPPATPAAAADRIIWASGATTGVISMSPLWIPLRMSTDYNTAGTPLTDETLGIDFTESAKLRLETASGVGSLLVTGIHCHQQQGRFHATGTPNMPLIFPTP